ncbi:MAG TPA: hypothetical protein PK916_04570 [Bacteroidota bacterium]|nr:hypothetical protein [Bacteroidota bacterium]
MATWVELSNEVETLAIQQKGIWFKTRLTETLADISRIRNTNVLFYFSGFLQKNGPFGSLSHEDINGFMSGLCGMDWSKPLTLLLHTPGGSPTAAQSVMEYLRTKFSHIEAIVPAMAMSAGTMMCLCADHIVLGNHSQLGPIDPQMLVNGRYVSAGAILTQFEEAKKEILKNGAVAPAWFPILNFLGPSLCVEAAQAIDFGKSIVAQWLENFMYKSHPNRTQRASETADYFSRNDLHLNHGRRIGKTEARSLEMSVEDLEADHNFQEAVLTAYHLGTILCSQTATVKFINTDQGNLWLKNIAIPQPQQPGMLTEE